MKPCVATVGTFDGIHPGHRAILARVISLAKALGTDSCAITFTNHPLTVVAPHKAPRWAQPRELSLDILARFVDHVHRLEFSPELASLTAAEFLALIRDKYNVGSLVMGYDNTFGSDRLSSHSDYIEAGRAAGVNVEFVDKVTTPGGAPVSSSLLRKAIARWDEPLLMDMLPEGPRFSLVVAHGRQLGHQLGFPTMNFAEPQDAVLPPDGVYAVRVALPGDGPDASAYAVLSIGTNPTVSPDGSRTWELHVPDRDLGDMYGRTVTFNILHKIRDIIKFSDLRQLAEQIKNDIIIAKSTERL